MATNVRATSTNSATTGTAISVSAPAGTTTGDLVLCFVHVNTDTTIVDNNGATSFTEDLNDEHPNATHGHTLSVFSRRIVGGDPATYNFTSGATGRWSVIAVTIQSPDATTIYDVVISKTNSSDANAPSHNCANITTITNNSIHIVAAALDDGTFTITGTPAGYTGVTTTNQPIGLGYKKIVSAGATGAQTVTCSDATGSSWIGVSLAIKDDGITSSVKSLAALGVG